MAFADDLIFPTSVSLSGLSGKRRRLSTIAENQGGFEQRGVIWTRTRREYNAGLIARPASEWLLIDQFFESCDGPVTGFRLADPLDSAATLANGVLWPIDAARNPIGSPGFGYGVPAFRLFKQVGVVAHPKYREIQKPFGTIIEQRNGSTGAAGSAAGNYAIDLNTGIATFVADAAQSVTAITVGSTTQVTLSAALAGLAVTGRLYLTGFSNTHAALLNNLSHPVTAISGGGGNVYTLGTDTAGKAISVGSATGWKYPQPSDALTWSGPFHTPCRFLNDDLDWSVVDKDGSGNLLVDGPIPLIEIRLVP